MEVVRDVDGMPHIRAATEDDALAALGLCHAQDRLWQMELLRRIVRGTLAELVGGAAVDDRPLRAHARPGRAWPSRRPTALEGDDLRAIEAYCRGVNAWLGAKTFRLPLELRLLLHRRVAEWTTSDALLGLRLFALGLGQNWEGEIVRSRLAARLGTARLEQLEPGYPVTGYTSLPAAAGEAVRAALAAKERAGGAEGAGSNSWVLSADRTTTGAPLLANDPHLLLGAPCTWYAADIAWDGERSAGFTSPGTPGIVIGQSAHAAWGFTNVEADTQDLVEVELDGSEERRVEEIRVRGKRRPVEHEVVTTAHGPGRRAARAGRDAHAGAAVDGARAGAQRRRVPRPRPGPHRRRRGRRAVGCRRPDPELRLRDAGRRRRVPDVRRPGAPAGVRRRAVSRPPSRGSGPSRTRSCRPGATRRTARS